MNLRIVIGEAEHRAGVSRRQVDHLPAAVPRAQLADQRGIPPNPAEQRKAADFVVAAGDAQFEIADHFSVVAGGGSDAHVEIDVLLLFVLLAAAGRFRKRADHAARIDHGSPQRNAKRAVIVALHVQRRAIALGHVKGGKIDGNQSTFGVELGGAAQMHARAGDVYIFELVGAVALDQAELRAARTAGGLVPAGNNLRDRRSGQVGIDLHPRFLVAGDTGSLHRNRAGQRRR